MGPEEERALRGWKPLDGGDAPSGSTSRGPSGALIAAIAVGLVLAVIGLSAVLAAIAIPNFLAMQLRSKRAEAPVHLDAVRTTVLEALESGRPVEAAPRCPDGDPGRSQRAWEGGCTARWDAVGWAPVGLVRCSYELDVEPGGPGTEDDRFLARASCDVDGDGIPSVYEADRASPARMVSANNVY